MHKPQPVHKSSNTMCNCFCAPIIASTGQTGKHFVQPIHAAASIATKASPFRDGLTATTSVTFSAPTSSAIELAVRSPPGGQWLTPTARLAIASAYGLQPSKPHCRHCVCGKSASTREEMRAVRSSEAAATLLAANALKATSDNAIIMNESIIRPTPAHPLSPGKRSPSTAIQ